MNKRILPEGYYIQNESNPYIVRLLMGPYKGLKFQICENVKIREDVLTNIPQLCYNYRVLDYANYESIECESSKKLSRIIAAIVVEITTQEIEQGGVIESICQKPELKASS